MSSKQPEDRLVVLTRRGDLHAMLVNRLARQFEIAAVAIETDRGRIRRKVFRRRLRRLGPLQVAGQLLYLAYERFPRPGARRRRQGLLAGADLRRPDGRFPVLEVGRINDPAVHELLDRLRPRLVVVSGTSLLRKPLLRRADCFLNIHCGITPRYRGVYGAYWAVYEGNLEGAGVTIHRIDPGVDTGEIAQQATITVEPTDDGRSLTIKQYLIGAELMAEAVGRALRGELSLSPATGSSRQWYHPTLWDQPQFRRRLREATRDACRPAA